MYYADSFTGAYADIAEVTATGPSSVWTDDGSQTGSHPSTVDERYYKIACHGTSSYAEYVVGMYKIVMGYAASLKAYTSASLPLIPYYSSAAPDINDVIGNQGHASSVRGYADKIWMFDTVSESFDRYCWNHDGTWEGYPEGAETTLDPGAGFAFLYKNSENDKEQGIFVVGKAARGNVCRDEIAGKGTAVSQYSFVGYTYLAEESLEGSHIREDGFTGSGLRGWSDKVWPFDFLSQSFKGYAWYNNTAWQYYNTSAFDLAPAEAYLIYNRNTAGDWTWIVTNPADY